jgi:GTPase Era involved in 16S rRNA processing
VVVVVATQAVILVERETQAPIVLGRGGSAIKKLGSAARNQIEDFLGRKVYLELSVQVRRTGYGSLSAPPSRIPPQANL